MNAISSLLERAQKYIFGNELHFGANGEIMQSSSALLALSKPDRKMIEKTFKIIDDILKSCQDSRLCLKNSPPFILDILPDTYAQLGSIISRDPSVIQNNVYIRIFLQNLQIKCKQVLKLFKTPGIYQAGSLERKSLIKLSLMFSHMLFELKSQFPEGNFIGDKFRITKREAEEFWNSSFEKKSMVTWEEFSRAINKLDNLGGPLKKNELISLKDTIDLTGNDHVSNFEFDVFTRLFYPWKTLLRNWKLLTTAHPGYVAFLTYDEVRQQLEKVIDTPGSYVFRLSCTRPGQWAIGYVAPDRKIYQTIPQNKSLIQALHEGSKEGFYRYPNGRKIKDVDLSKMLEIPSAERVMVTDEQYELYCEMGTTFELCKICDDRDKNVRLEPCGHLLCTPCLTSWQQSDNGGTCPFCRYEIKSTSRVVFDKACPQLVSPNIEKAAAGVAGTSTSPVGSNETEDNANTDVQSLTSQMPLINLDGAPSIPPSSVKPEQWSRDESEVPNIPPPLPPRTVRRTLA